MSTITWEDDVADHDYAAARDYLSLLLDSARANKAVAAFKRAKVTERRANDILRACRREPLTLADDPGVRRDESKVDQGKKLSPILVVTFDFGADIADGYHRASLAYCFDPFDMVPLKIVKA